MTDLDCVERVGAGYDCEPWPDASFGTCLPTRWTNIIARVPRAVDADDAWLREQLSLPRASLSLESEVTPPAVAPAVPSGAPAVQAGR